MVEIADEKRFTRTIAGLRTVILHEYGHAYDNVFADTLPKRIRHIDKELRKDYDGLKPLITDEWRKEAKAKLDKAFADAQVSKLSAEEIKGIKEDFALKEAKLQGDFCSAKSTMSYSTYKKKLEELIFERDKKLGITEQMAAVNEMRYSLSDIVEAL